MLVIQIAGGLVLVILVAAFFLRGRGRAGKGGRDKTRGDFRPTLPPSPYQPSRGFRLLSGEEADTPAPVQLPRLDPNKEFVFHDVPSVSGESVSPPQLRHDERWALERSMRHSAHPRLRHRRRWAWSVLALVLAGAVAAVLVWRHAPAGAAHHAGLALATLVRLL